MDPKTIRWTANQLRYYGAMMEENLKRAGFLPEEARNCIWYWRGRVEGMADMLHRAGGGSMGHEYEEDTDDLAVE